MTEELIRALHDRGNYGHDVDRVECIETHISWVLLAGEFVYKVKKPLDLGFLDFTELERRRFYCDEELRLNRRTAPDLYLDVVAITGTKERPRIDGDGDPIEYAVRMRRFETRMGFDRMLDRGRLKRCHIADLAARLAELHRTAGVAEAEQGYGTFDEIAGPMRDNFEALEASSGRFDRARIDRLRQWTERQLARFRGDIDDRLRAGFVRECHGDAHLGNVTLYQDRATLFDCIEFSADLRWIDVINDMAFTFMDLRDRGAPGLAWVLLDEYLARTGDFDGVRLLPLYTVYRAMVRAKVQTFARDQAESDDSRRQLDGEIEGYLALADRVAAEHRPAMVVTMGLSGSGKSWLAERLVERAGTVRIRSDVERKRLHGLAADESSGSELNQQIYSEQATDRTYQRLADAAGSVCDAGMPALLDATFLKRWQRDRIRERARSSDIPFAIVHCTAPERELVRRIRERDRRGDDPSEAGVDVLAAQRRSAESLAPAETRVAIEVDTRAPEAVEGILNRLPFEPAGSERLEHD
jgi:hypothetical protein